jgi:hypothetical protein
MSQKSLGVRGWVHTSRLGGRPARQSYGRTWIPKSVGDVSSGHGQKPIDRLAARALECSSTANTLPSRRLVGYKASWLPKDKEVPQRRRRVPRRAAPEGRTSGASPALRR